MPVINCVCGTRLQAAGFETLLEALRAHTEQAHAELGISDDDLRELIDRARASPWEGETVPLTGGIQVRPLLPERRDDFLAFFDRDAFVDNPAWAACYCLFYQFSGTMDDWEQRSAAENRAEKAALIDSGRAQGYLAYHRGHLVGWCHAAPRGSLPMLDRFEHFRTESPERVGSIVCFVVPARYRRQGIATRLLDAACEGLRSRGLSVAEAYPRKDDRSDARAYHGPLPMYLRAGFREYRDAGQWVIVRRDLAAASPD